MEGYGYEWDAELVGGPADGCVDRVIQLDTKQPYPPEIFKRLLDKPIERSKLGEKLLEEWSLRHLSSDTKIALYKLRSLPDEDDDHCCYDYLETLTVADIKRKYGEL